MIKIVADDKIPFLKGALDSCAKVVYLPGGKISPADVADADAIITRTRTKCNAKLLENSRVSFIATATIGYDHIDTDYCDSHNIKWTNAPGCNSASVSQYICSMLLCRAIRTGTTLRGKTLGVIGVGNVGSKVAKMARALGMNVMLNDPPRERAEGSKGFSSLADIMRDADFITVHVPLDCDSEDMTFHLANDAFFANLKRKPFFINSSRGEVCDGDALKRAVSSGLVLGAALDVWENEPEIDTAQMGMLAYATPHIAGYSTDGKANGTAMSVNALAKHFSLPVSDFFPSNVPAPENPVIKLVSGGTFEEAVFEAVSRSYDIRNDDARLRASVKDFEKLRGDYPLRREFPAFSVVPSAGTSKDVSDTLKLLGFKILN